MKLNFKIQQYQTDAVNAVIQVFNGQGYQNKLSYMRDLGNAPIQTKITYETDSDSTTDNNEIDIGFKNEIISLTDDDLLSNIKKVQNLNNIKHSIDLVKNLGRCSLDIEMETGTGKTYVYLKTMFELNKHYG